jgi:hypothetical protein
MPQPPHLHKALAQLIHYYTIEEILSELALVAEEHARQIPLVEPDAYKAHRAWSDTARALHRCTAMVRPFFT